MAPDWLPGKKRFRLFNTNDHDRLGLTDRLVYGYLAYRARIGQPATKVKIASEVGLHRTKTVPLALDRLTGPELGLVEEVEGGYTALEPPAEVAGLFYHLRVGEHWSQRLGYNWYYPVRDGLTTQQNYLLWVLHGMPGHTHNQTGLEKLTGLTRKTVAAALERLVGLGFIEVRQATGFRFGASITGLDPDLFFDRNKANHVGDWSPQEAQAAEWLEMADIPNETASEKTIFGKLVRDLARTDDPGGVLIAAKVGHDKYLASKGGMGPPHCGFRLRIDIDKILCKVTEQ